MRSEVRILSGAFRSDPHRRHGAGFSFGTKPPSRRDRWWNATTAVASLSSPVSEKSAPGRNRLLLLVGIVLIALNLRPALASVGPLVGAIHEDTGLSHVALGLLTTLPLIAFGLLSVLAPLATRALGMGGALFVAMILTAVGTGIRAVPAVAFLFLGTVILGIGIALGNVLLPAVVKRHFPRHSGALTSLYSSAMGIGATVAAGVSVPLASQLGWRGALGVWAVPAVMAVVAWVPRRRQGGGRSRQTLADFGSSLRSLGRSRLAWQIALFMGLQSLTFYVILAWLPEILQSRGLSAERAGWLLALSQATGVLGSATVPLWAGRRDDQRVIVWLLGLLEAVSLGGLLAAASETMIAWSVGILGFVLGGTFGLALIFLVIRAADSRETTGLSGMAQTVGYIVAAVGPVVFGLMYDMTRTWSVPLLFLVAALVAKVAAGVSAARPRLA